MNEFVNGSKIEILPGTQYANSGPHPPVIHADEVELMDPETWEEAHALEQRRLETR